MTTRADVHSIVDELSEDQLQEAKAYLEAVRSGAGQDRLTKLLLAAPYDDEPFTEEQRRAVEASRLRDRTDPPIPWTEFEKSLEDG